MLKEDYLKRQFTKRQFHYVFENTGLEDFPYMHLYSAFEIGQGRLVWNSVLERHDLVPFDLLYLAAKKFTKFDKPEAILLCQSWFDLRNDPIEQGNLNQF